jgi:hypothetical protein
MLTDIFAVADMPLFLAGEHRQEPFRESLPCHFCVGELRKPHRVDG